MRSCGILMHITSLPGPYGIGSLGEEARRFVDFLEAAGQRYWQILPTTPAGTGNSPYSSFSVFAGNPLFLDLESLVGEGLLSQAECRAEDFGNQPHRVDYEKVRASKQRLLRLAYGRMTQDAARRAELDAFREREALWLPDYALYMALKDRLGGAWYHWEEDLRFHQPQAVERWGRELREDVSFWCFTQFLFWRQWTALKRYANGRGVRIIGDLPIYVAMDSADVWAQSELFQLDERRRPIAVAGVPPDAFSATGQLWGNPLYRWDAMARDGYAWWVRRIRHTLEVCDLVRLDHFRGFDAYYSIPYGDETAENGRWMDGPGLALFRAVEAAVPHPAIIAEDLGVLTDRVRKLLADTGFPGMKILQFAFDSDWKNPYLPFQFLSDHCVVYTGTHDNDTALGWYRSIDSRTRRRARTYLHLRRSDAPNWKLAACAYSTRAELAIVQMQDFLGLGSEARMNTPGVAEGNWTWRADPHAFTEELAWHIRCLAQQYQRES